MGYPKDNIIFQQPDRAILYQDGKLVMDVDITKEQELVDVVRQFLNIVRLRSHNGKRLPRNLAIA